MCPRCSCRRVAFKDNESDQWLCGSCVADQASAKKARCAVCVVSRVAAKVKTPDGQSYTLCKECAVDQTARAQNPESIYSAIDLLAGDERGSSFKWVTRAVYRSLRASTLDPKKFESKHTLRVDFDSHAHARFYTFLLFRLFVRFSKNCIA
jgi:hypothetical protein